MKNKLVRIKHFFRYCGRYSSQGLNDNFALTTLSLELILEPLLVPIFSFNLAPEMFDIPPLSRPSFAETNSREKCKMCIPEYELNSLSLWKIEFLRESTQKKDSFRRNFLKYLEKFM